MLTDAEFLRCCLVGSKFQELMTVIKDEAMQLYQGGILVGKPQA